MVLLTQSDESDQASLQSTTEEVSEQETGPATEASAPVAEPTGGAYVDLSDGEVTTDELTQFSGVRIVFFHAPWCPQCRALDADIEANGVPEGATIIKVDYDSNQALRQKYGVTIQTTLVEIDPEGEKIESYVAYDDPTIAAVKENLL